MTPPDNQDDLDSAYDPTDIANRGIWHNPEVSKSDLYVGELLLEHIKSGKADLEDAHLVGIHLEHARLADINLQNADLRDANLQGADLTRADLRNCNLKRANLRQADLEDANLEGADLTRTHLGEANLQHANLRNAVLNDTVLMNADLRQADLAGAQVFSFSWNRLTRFSGVHGFETPETDETKESGDELATARFAAPLAMGDHDISGSKRAAIGDYDPSLEKTHVYRAKPKGASRKLPAVEESIGPEVTLVATPPTEIPQPPNSDEEPTKQQTIVVQSSNKRWVVMTFIAISIAIISVGTSALLLLRTHTDDGDSGNRQIAQHTDASMIQLKAENRALEQSVQTYKDRIAHLTAESKHIRNHVQTLDAQLKEEIADKRQVEIRNQWLTTLNDEALSIRDQLERSNEERKQLQKKNKRLEDTATVLANSVYDLEKENTHIKNEVYSQVQDLHRIEELGREVDVLKAKLKASEEARLIATTQNSDIKKTLNETDLVLNSLYNRIRGTVIEDLLSEANEKDPAFAVEPGKTITFSGDYLVSLNIDRNANADRLDINLVLQASLQDTIPEMTLILYGESGKPIRKMTISYPDIIGTNGFASMATTITSRQFPTSARLILTPGLNQKAQLSALD